MRDRSSSPDPSVDWFVADSLHLKSISIAWVDVQFFMEPRCDYRDAKKYSERLSVRGVSGLSIFVGIVTEGMCIAVGSVLKRADAKNAGAIARRIARALKENKTIATESGIGEGGGFWVKKSWGITLTRRGLNLRGFPRRCAWLLR